MRKVSCLVLAALLGFVLTVHADADSASDQSENVQQSQQIPTDEEMQAIILQEQKRIEEQNSKSATRQILEKVIERAKSQSTFNVEASPSIAGTTDSPRDGWHQGRRDMHLQEKIEQSIREAEEREAEMKRLAEEKRTREAEEERQREIERWEKEEKDEFRPGVYGVDYGSETAR